ARTLRDRHVTSRLAMELDRAGYDRPVCAEHFLRELQTLPEVSRLHLQLRRRDPLHVVQGISSRGLAHGAEVRGRGTLENRRLLDQCGGCKCAVARIADAPGALRKAFFSPGIRAGEPGRLPS